MPDDWRNIPVVDVLLQRNNFVELFEILKGVGPTPSILSVLQEIAANTAATSTKLDEVITRLGQVYDRLEHVKVDSYVNVRVVDELGIAPVPCTEATGLLVSAVLATEDALPVAVVNPFLSVHVDNVPHVEVDGIVYVDVNNVAHVNVDNIPHVVVDNTVAVSGDVYADLRLKNAFSGLWQDALGFGVTETLYWKDSTPYIGTQSGVVTMSAVGGNNQGTSADGFLISTSKEFTDLYAVSTWGH